MSSLVLFMCVNVVCSVNHLDLCMGILLAGYFWRIGWGLSLELQMS